MFANHSSRLQVVAVSCLTLLSSDVSAGVAQEVPGTRLDVTVEIVSVRSAGGMTSVSYRLVNQESSEEQVLMFMVDAPAAPLEVSTPMPEFDWTSGTRFDERSVALWGVLGDQLQPGTAGPVLTATAAGLPVMVEYWVHGFAPPPPVLPTDDGFVPPLNILDAASVRGMTIGVAPAPPGATPLTLLERLQGMLGDLCASEGLIRGICVSLGAHVDAAQRSLHHGDTDAARGSLRSFLRELEAQHGEEPEKHVPTTGYWLLRASAESILQAMP